MQNNKQQQTEIRILQLNNLEHTTSDLPNLDLSRFQHLLKTILEITKTKQLSKFRSPTRMFLETQRSRIGAGIQYVTYTSRRFQLKTVLMLMDQMISRVQYIHDRKLIHRDLKPENFCLGFNKMSHKIFLIDFGLSRTYLRRNGKHINCEEGLNMFGTAIYASINNYLEMTCRIRGDIILERLAILAGFECQQQKSNEQINWKKKMETSIEQLCQGYPKQFANYLTQCRSLKFDERPPYEAFRAMFREFFQKNGYKFDYQYDWVILQQKKQKIQKKQQLTKQEA